MAGDDLSGSSAADIHTYIETPRNLFFSLAGFMVSQANYVLVCTYVHMYEYIDTIHRYNTDTYTEYIPTSPENAPVSHYGRGLACLARSRL